MLSFSTDTFDNTSHTVANWVVYSLKTDRKNQGTSVAQVYEDNGTGPDSNRAKLLEAVQNSTSSVYAGIVPFELTVLLPAIKSKTGSSSGATDAWSSDEDEPTLYTDRSAPLGVQKLVVDRSK